MSNRSTIPSGPVALARSPAMPISVTCQRSAGQRQQPYGQSPPFLWRMCTSGCYNCIQGVYPCLDSDKFRTISITIPPAKRICVAK
jgi:hypothetical protein